MVWIRAGWRRTSSPTWMTEAGVRVSAHSRALGANRVVVALSVAALLALWGLAAIGVAPNRIVPGTPLKLAEVAGWYGALLGSLPLLALEIGRASCRERV